MKASKDGEFSLFDGDIGALEFALARLQEMRLKTPRPQQSKRRR